MTGGRVKLDARIAAPSPLFPWHRALTECASAVARWRSAQSLTIPHPFLPSPQGEN